MGKWTSAQAPVASLLQYYTKNSQAGNARAVADLYADDAKIVIIGGSTITGRENIYQSLVDEYSSSGRIAPEVKTDEIYPADGADYAFAYETCVEDDGSVYKVWMKLGFVNDDLRILEEQILCTRRV